MSRAPVTAMYAAPGGDVVVRALVDRFDDIVERDPWRACMYRALDETGAAVAVQRRIRPPLAELANFPRNR